MDMQSNLDLKNNQLLNARLHPSATAPVSPATGQPWYDTTTNLLKYWNGTKWVTDKIEDFTGTAPIVVNKTDPANPVISISAASTSAAGSMSAADKTKLDAATSSATASTLVQRDASGGASFGVVAATKVTSSSAASAATDVPNLQQVQSLLAGHGNFVVVRAVATANITTAGSAPNTLDGVTLVAGDLLLLTGQTSGPQNGVYSVTTLGTGANGTWTRVSDNSTPHFVTSAGLRATVAEGTSYADTEWLLTTNNPIVVGTTSLTWAQQDGASKILAGAALLKTGNTFDVQTDGATIQISSNKLEIKAPYKNFLATGTITGTGAATTFDITVPSVTTLLSVRIEDATGNQVMVDNYLYSATAVRVIFGIAPANGVVYNVKILAA